MRKQLQAEHGKADQEKRINDLETARTKKDNKLLELKAKKDAIDRRGAEHKESEAKKRQKEVDFLKYQEDHLQRILAQVSEK